jgi:hypothetical protein
VSGPGCWAAPQSFSTPGNNAPQLYVRIGASETLKISEAAAGVIEAGSSEPGERPVPYPTEFVGASEDGSRVFFVTAAWLTADHPLAHDPELYECEIVQSEAGASCELTRISAGVEGQSGQSEGAQVFGVQAVASQGGAVYFLAFGALAPGAAKDEVKGIVTNTPVNLYRYQPESSSGAAQTTFIASVSTNNRNNEEECRLGRFAPCVEESWYTTPDGRYLLFASEVDLTADAHTEGSDCEVPNSQGIRGRCAELYRYDAGAAGEGEQSIVCVSCDPGGDVPTGNALFSRSNNAQRAGAPARGMSDDGGYVFFDTPTPLVSGATNGSLNVYEWHEGIVSLLDSGAEPGASFFLGYSPFVTPGGQVVEGGNVFIGTHDKLVAGTTSSVGNVYDVRVCVVESPCIQPPVGGTAQCEASACQTPPVAPAKVMPSSLTVAGPDNFVSPAVVTPVVGVTRAQRLVKALASCRKQKVKKRRVACEGEARKKYGVAKKKKAPVKKAVKRVGSEGRGR